MKKYNKTSNDRQVLKKRMKKVLKNIKRSIGVKKKNEKKVLKNIKRSTGVEKRMKKKY